MYCGTLICFLSSIYLSIYLSTSLSINLSVYLSIRLSVCLSVCIYQSIYPSVYCRSISLSYFPPFLYTACTVWSGFVGAVGCLLCFSQRFFEGISQETKIAAAQDTGRGEKRGECSHQLGRRARKGEVLRPRENVLGVASLHRLRACRRLIVHLLTHVPDCECCKTPSILFPMNAKIIQRQVQRVVAFQTIYCSAINRRVHR